MEMGYYARRTLVPALMDWVEKSRLRKSLPAHECEFIKDLGDGFLQINLSNLDEGYIKKHVEPDMKKYCDAFTKHITPVLKAWCIKCNMQEAKISMRFQSRSIVNTSVKINISWQELSENR